MLQKLKQEMEKQNMTKYALAKKADIAQSDLYSVFRGERPMFPNWRKRIDKALNVDEEQLFYDEGGSKNNEH